MRGWPLYPIGHVENAVTKRMDPDRFIGVQSKIVVDEAYVKGLEGLEAGMELLVLFAFHLSAGAPLMVHPRGDVNREKRGVFATCSPNRPNGIGTGHCKLLGRDGNILVVEDLEAMNGSPVIDIKPLTACARCERVRAKRALRVGAHERRKTHIVHCDRSDF